MEEGQFRWIVCALLCALLGALVSLGTSPEKNEVCVCNA